MAPTQLDSAKKEKIRKQVEFYFSDSNLPRDKFLMQKIEAHPEGYVELAIIAAFSRTAQHLGREPGQRPDEIPDNVVAQLADTLQGSEDLQVSEDKQYVKRKLPLNIESRVEMIQEMDKRTIYARPFPFDSTLDDLTPRFSEYAPVKAVRLRRFLNSKDFKGSVFVEFEDPESAHKVAAMTGIEHEGATLRIEMKTDYLARKAKEQKEHAKKGGLPPAIEIQNEAAKTDAPTQLWPSQREPQFEPGLVIGFSIQGEAEMPTDLHYNTVRSAFGGKEAGIAFVEYAKGTQNGCLRLTGEEAKATLLAKRDTDGRVPVGDLKAELSVLEGEEEKAFYIRADQNRLRAEKAKRSGGGTFVVEKRKSDFGDRRGRGRGRFGRAGRINNVAN